MSDETPLDQALSAMQAAPGDATARLRVYHRIAGSELVLLLAAEAEDDRIEPRVFDLADGRFVLVFDREERLAEFAGGPAPYAALSGRAVAAMLAGQGLGLGVNLGSGDAATLLPPDAVDWLADTLRHAPDEAEARIVALSAPRGLPETLLGALDARLASAAGLARSAWLAGAEFDGGWRGHVLGILGAAPGAEAALARAINEALVFSGIEAGTLDVAFLRDSDPLAARLARVGLRFDLPDPPSVDTARHAAPGSDPSKPPILR